MSTTFAFTNLPTELALEIIQLAAAPALHTQEDTTTQRRPYYNNALSLAQVSYAFRSATMPHLLRAVVLTKTVQVHKFILSMYIQKLMGDANSRLALDYYTLVERFLVTECWEGLAEHWEDDYVDYASLYQLLCKTGSIGITSHTAHVLYNSLGAPGVNPAVDWGCNRVTVCGSFMRWKPFTSTFEGLAFLARITHLCLWIIEPPHMRAKSRSQGLVLPSWFRQIPFNEMINLSHLAIPLVSYSDTSDIPSKFLVYSIPTSQRCPTSPAREFREWGLGEDPLGRGRVVELGDAVPESEEDFQSWERAFIPGDVERKLWVESKSAQT